MNSASDTKDTKDTEARPGAFPVTRWSLLAQAASGPGDVTALEELCQKYWHPVYAFVRRRGMEPHEAEDLTQGFFAFLLERQALKNADPAKGKFRTFLLAALTNFLANEWDKQRALKRGGGRQLISLDETTAMNRYEMEPSATLSPEKLFDRRWVLSVLNNALARLEAQHAGAKKAELFAKLEPALTGAPEPGWFASTALSLDMTENAVRVALHRLRRQFGESLRAEIAETVGSAEAVEEEIRHLFVTLSG
jgi:RNA polymerase sigma-70 factor (ECF subfamily)